RALPRPGPPRRLASVGAQSKGRPRRTPARRPRDQSGRVRHGTARLRLPSCSPPLLVAPSEPTQLHGGDLRSRPSCRLRRPAKRIKDNCTPVGLVRRRAKGEAPGSRSPAGDSEWLSVRASTAVSDPNGTSAESELVGGACVLTPTTTAAINPIGRATSHTTTTESRTSGPD